MLNSDKSCSKLTPINSNCDWKRVYLYHAEHAEMCLAHTMLLFTTLCLIQLAVDSVVCNELWVGTLLHHNALVNYNYLVSVLDSRQPMSNDQACATNLCPVKSFLHHLNSNNTTCAENIQATSRERLHIIAALLQFKIFLKLQLLFTGSHFYMIWFNIKAIILILV